MTFPLNRVYIICFCVICIVTVYLLVNRTKLGLLLRATTQNRDMAAAWGSNPPRRWTHIRLRHRPGWARRRVVPLYNKINPNIGQEYIVDSFMVVVTGGVGKLAGVIWAGLGLGFLNKYLEALLNYVPAVASVSLGGRQSDRADLRCDFPPMAAVRICSRRRDECPMPDPAAPVTESQKGFRNVEDVPGPRPHPDVFRLRAVVVIAVLAFFFVGVPILDAAGLVPDYKVNILGKYLSFCDLALGIDLIWGYTGLLSLCQALFFCVGGYIMAMHLSVAQGGGDVRPEYNNIPQFMFFNNVKVLPLFWTPFTSMTVTLIAGFALPALFGGIFGFFILRSRVRGVYFSIVTQALAWAAFLLISRNEMLMGGTNGLTNFYKPMIQERKWILGLYLLTLVMLVLAYLLCRWIVRSRLGRVLVAIRDKETRLYFAGYKPYVFKVFAFAVAAMLGGVGGMLYSPQVGIITPQNMSVEESIFMVVWVALGGRGNCGARFSARCWCSLREVRSHPIFPPPGWSCSA